MTCTHKKEIYTYQPTIIKSNQANQYTIVIIMAPSVLASFPTFPSLALAGPGSLPCSYSYDPIYLSRSRDFHFDHHRDDDYDDDDEADEYQNCLSPALKYPRTTRIHNNNNNNSISGCASRLTRRISGSSTCSSLSSLSSKTGGLTRGARKFVSNLVRFALFSLFLFFFPLSACPPPFCPSLYPPPPPFSTLSKVTTN